MTAPRKTASPEVLHYEVGSADAMRALGAACTSAIDASVVVAIDGELGAGKTVFVRGMAEGLGIDPSLVSSPTFVVMQRYTGGRMDLLHGDAYRLQSAAELDAIGWGDAVNDRGVVAVLEWASRVEASIPGSAIRIVLTHGESATKSARMLTLTDPDPVRAIRMQLAMDRAILGAPCPICGRAVAPADASSPFCSPRCRSADLGRWLSERYRVARPLGDDDFEGL